MASQRYRIGELAQLAGVSVRTLRFYEEVGLLAPCRDAQNGYRVYGKNDVDRLQDILLLRNMGIPVQQIAPLLADSPKTRARALREHLTALRQERDRMSALIANVERTINHLETGALLMDAEKFEGMKRELVEENEAKYGAEVRERWGNKAVDESNRKMLGLTQEQFDVFQQLGTQINATLEENVRAGADPAGAAGREMYDMHRAWLGYTWNFYTPEAHRGLAEGYVADERFRSYYDGTVPGCAQWLRDAIVAHAHE